MRRAGAALALALAACGAEPAPAPPPATDRAEAPIPTAPPPPASTAAAALPAPELDGVGTALGSWTIRDGRAWFGPPGAAAYFILACDRAARRVTMARIGDRDDAARLRIVTDSAAASMTARIDPGPPRAATGSLAADDLFLTALLRAKDRFGVRIDDHSTLAMPMAPQVRQVIEDCRRPA